MHKCSQRTQDLVNQMAMLEMDVLKPDERIPSPFLTPTFIESRTSYMRLARELLDSDPTQFQQLSILLRCYKYCIKSVIAAHQRNHASVRPTAIESFLHQAIDLYTTCKTASESNEESIRCHEHLGELYLFKSTTVLVDGNAQRQAALDQSRQEYLAALSRDVLNGKLFANMCRVQVQNCNWIEAIYFSVQSRWAIKPFSMATMLQERFFQDLPQASTFSAKWTRFFLDYHAALFQNDSQTIGVLGKNYATAWEGFVTTSKIDNPHWQFFIFGIVTVAALAQSPDFVVDTLKLFAHIFQTASRKRTLHSASLLMVYIVLYYAMKQRENENNATISSIPTAFWIHLCAAINNLPPQATRKDDKLEKTNFDALLGLCSLTRPDLDDSDSEPAARQESFDLDACKEALAEDSAKISARLVQWFLPNEPLSVYIKKELHEWKFRLSTFLDPDAVIAPVQEQHKDTALQTGSPSNATPSPLTDHSPKSTERHNNVLATVKVDESIESLKERRLALESHKKIIEVQKNQKKTRIDLATCYIVTDTNVWMQNLPALSAKVASDKYFFLVPLVVMEELAGLLQSPKADCAQAALDYFARVQTSLTSIKAVTSQGDILRDVHVHHELRSDEGNYIFNNDDVILELCKALPKKLSNNQSKLKNVILMTNDVNLRLKSRAMALHSLSWKEFDALSR